VFAPGKLLQSSLMFAGKAGAYPSKAPFLEMAPEIEKGQNNYLSIGRIYSLLYLWDNLRANNTLKLMKMDYIGSFTRTNMDCIFGLTFLN
jgi:hypothetical protein